MPESKPPPSSVAMPPKHGGNGAFVAAAAVMLLLMGGLIWWKVGGKDPVPPAAPLKTASAEPQSLEAPPPPPPPPVVTVDAGKQQEQRGTKVGGKWTGPSGCAGDCTGTAPPGLKSALGAKAGQARGCYERALRQNPMLQGRIVIGVRVGEKGQVCSAGISSNGTGDPGVASCVLGMFRSASFPAPNGGCVDVNVPMNFVPKT